MKYNELLEKVTFRDNFMFQSVMQSKDICQEVLEKILGFKLSKIAFPEIEKSQSVGFLSHSVRFDVYVESEDGKAFDIEMQNVNHIGLLKRARYYHVMLDRSSLDKGEENYGKMRDGYVIFICNFPLFDHSSKIYTVEKAIRGKPNVPYEDGEKTIFLCTEGEDGDASIELIRFLSYIKNGIPSDTLTEKIDEKVRFWKSNENWGSAYMENKAWEWDFRNEGREEGLKEGHKEGLKEGEQRAEARFQKEQERLGKLLEFLARDARMEPIAKVATDIELREKLYKEYGIE